MSCNKQGEDPPLVLSDGEGYENGCDDENADGVDIEQVVSEDDGGAIDGGRGGASSRGWRIRHKGGKRRKWMIAERNAQPTAKTESSPPWLN
jgi:hypothetical protein